MRALRVTVVVPCVCMCVCVCVYACVCVCVCMSVHSFLPPHAPRLRNIGTYVFTATRKNFYINIYIKKFRQLNRLGVRFACN